MRNTHGSRDAGGCYSALHAGATSPLPLHTPFQDGDVVTLGVDLGTGDVHVSVNNCPLMAVFRAAPFGALTAAVSFGKDAAGSSLERLRLHVNFGETGCFEFDDKFRVGGYEPLCSVLGLGEGAAAEDALD